MSKQIDLDNSRGQQLILAGMAHLVRDEGYTVGEALRVTKNIGQEAFIALRTLREENN